MKNFKDEIYWYENRILLEGRDIIVLYEVNLLKIDRNIETPNYRNMQVSIAGTTKIINTVYSK